MRNKIKRFTKNQLIVFLAFLRQADKVVTVHQLEKTTGLHGKSLGGVISSLSRTKFRNVPLIEPMGASLDGSGLRWLLNSRLIEIGEVIGEVNRLINLYE